MKKYLFLFLLISTSIVAGAQKVDSIFFHLYTDSLKKGFYNYINVDGKTADGKWLPLTSHEVVLTSNAGSFEGNDLFIDSCYKADSVVVMAALKSNPAVKKEIIIYIRKRGFDETLKSEEEIFSDLKKQKGNQKQKKN